MKTLLIVFHSPSDNTQAMVDKMVDAVKALSLQGFNLVVKPPLEASAKDVLNGEDII